jgi:S1-C subfamily serine protease
MRRLAGLLACAALLGGCGGGDDGAKTKTVTTKVQVLEQSAGAEGERRTSFDPRRIYKDEAPGVVTVVSLFGSQGLDSIIGGGGGDQGGVGSGFVVSRDGEIATNAHVVTTGEGDEIKRANQLYVEFADGNQVEAKIVGFDPNADIALIKVDPQGLTLRPLPLAKDSEVQVGTPVAAIGSPFGEKQSLSVGVVSAVDRAIGSLTEFQISGAIQTDAAINPGNSGGPLVGADGRVIGINQQIETKSGGGEGVGFAVPIDVVKRSLDQLRSGGAAHYAYLGVASVGLYPQLVEHFKLDVAKGAWVQDVSPGGPAADAGLRGGSGAEPFQASSYRRGGDVITKVGGTAIDSSDALTGAVARFKPGETVTVQVRRAGATRDVKVKLGERPLGTPAQSGG